MADIFIMVEIWSKFLRDVNFFLAKENLKNFHIQILIKLKKKWCLCLAKKFKMAAKFKLEVKTNSLDCRTSRLIVEISRN
jgi:hypothetical protein